MHWDEQFGLSHGEFEVNPPSLLLKLPSQELSPMLSKLRGTLQSPGDLLPHADSDLIGWRGLGVCAPNKLPGNLAAHLGPWMVRGP